MALRISRFGYQRCAVDQIFNRRNEAACRNLHHWVLEPHPLALHLKTPTWVPHVRELKDIGNGCKNHDDKLSVLSVKKMIAMGNATAESAWVQYFPWCLLNCFHDVQQGESSHFLRRLVIRCPNSVPQQSLKFRRVPMASSGTAPPSLSNHILDCVSGFLLNKAKELMGSSRYAQPLEQLLRKESFVSQSNTLPNCCLMNETWLSPSPIGLFMFTLYVQIISFS